MKYFVTKAGVYYQGDMANPDDVEVPQRPSAAYDWFNGRWVLNTEREKAEHYASFKPLTPRQVRMVLTANGLRSQVEGMIAQASQDIKDTWEFSLAFERGNAVLLAMATQLGLSEKQVDDLFTQGALL